MKRIIQLYRLAFCFFWCFIVCGSHAQEYTKNVRILNSTHELTDDFVNRLCSAIYLAEGGAKAKAPYGVLSIKTDSTEQARRITLNSIRNNWKRWEKAGCPGEFVDFMADRWCPKSADPVGNRNWKKNVKYYLNHK